MGRTVWVQRLAGFVAAEFLRLVWWTNKFVLDPPDIYERVEPDMPVIVAFWHGQHFMMPFLKRPKYPAKVLISRHRDGEINAVAAERLGMGTVRGSGDHGNSFHRKGGVAAFKAMVQVLEQNINMALTADVPKVSRKAGLGIVTLARLPVRKPATAPLTRVAAVARELEVTFYDAWNLDRAATRAGMSRRHFSVLFRRVTGHTFWEHLTDLRLTHAAQLLQQGDHSVTGVVFSCGFGDVSQFYRLFRARFKHPPREWAVATRQGKPR